MQTQHCQYFHLSKIEIRIDADDDVVDAVEALEQNPQVYYIYLFYRNERKEPLQKRHFFHHLQAPKLPD
jgi:hypothetical protein